MILAEEMAAMDWYSGINQARREAHAEGLEALVKNLKPLLPDINSVLEAIQKSKGFENTTLDMVKKYW